MSMSMSKQGLRAGLAAAVLAAAAGGGWTWWDARRALESTDNAYVQGDITVIAPKVAGTVALVAAEDQALVKAGDLLVRLDDRDPRARLAEAEAAVAAARAAITAAERQAEAQAAQVAEAEAGLHTWEADLRLANQDLERITALASRDVASRQRLDTARATQDKARAGLTQARAHIESARRQIAVIAAEHRRAEALLAQAEAQAEAARIAVEDTVIRAPVDGVVGNRAVRQGQYVAPGTPLLAVVPLASVWVEANFKETQIGRLVPGQPVSIAIDAFPDQPVRGVVAGLSPASGAEFSLLPPENATGNFTKVVQRLPVRIELAADHPLAGRLRPGLSVAVTVDTAGALQAVPRSAAVRARPAAAAAAALAAMPADVE